MAEMITLNKDTLKKAKFDVGTCSNELMDLLNRMSFPEMTILTLNKIGNYNDIILSCPKLETLVIDAMKPDTENIVFNEDCTGEKVFKDGDDSPFNLVDHKVGNLRRGRVRYWYVYKKCNVNELQKIGLRLETNIDCNVYFRICSVN